MCVYGTGIHLLGGVDFLRRETSGCLSRFASQI
jgi:hypothetical protein